MKPLNYLKVKLASNSYNIFINKNFPFPLKSFFHELSDYSRIIVVTDKTIYKNFWKFPRTLWAFICISFIFLTHLHIYIIYDYADISYRPPQEK